MIENTKPQMTDVDALVCHPDNPRLGNVSMIAESIQHNGWYGTVIAQKSTKFVLAGNHRLKAAREIGIDKVPVIWLDVEDDKARRILLADNRTSDVATYDEASLMQLLKDCTETEIGLLGSGYDDAYLQDLLDQHKPDFEGLTDPDSVPEPPEEPITKSGDLWILGDHRLLCGDATNSKDVSNLVEPGTAEILLTDPPYNVDYTGGTGLKIQNDSMSDSDFRRFLVDSFSLSFESLSPGGAFYIWHADSEGYQFRGAVQDCGQVIRQCLVWVKSSLVLGRQDYHWQHEPCLYGWKGGASHRWYADRSHTTVVVDDARHEDVKKMKKDELLQFAIDMIEKQNSTPSTVIREDKPSRNVEHPTMKPVRLIAKLIRNSTLPMDIIYDPFLGSGTTMIAAEQLGRRCCGMEIDPVYCDVIVKRWEDFTGGEAKRS